MADLIEISCTNSTMQSVIIIRPLPKYLAASFRALENLYSISISTPYFYERLQDFENLTFSFQFKRERILKAKSCLLGGLMRPEEKFEDPKLIIEFISLVENLVAFAETHYISIKEFSRVMHQQLNEKQTIVIETTKINEQLQILNKLQIQNRQMLLKLPLHQMKQEESEQEQEESEQKEQFTEIEEIKVEENQIENQKDQTVNNQEQIVIQNPMIETSQEEANIEPLQEQAKPQLEYIETQNIKPQNIEQPQQQELKLKTLISTVKVSQKIAKLQKMVHESLYCNDVQEEMQDKQEILLERPQRKVRPATRQQF